MTSFRIHRYNNENDSWRQIAIIQKQGIETIEDLENFLHPEKLGTPIMVETIVSNGLDIYPNGHSEIVEYHSTRKGK